LLLFDEPLSNLDVSLREETRSELRELVTRLGLTAVYVTHDQEEAYALCDRISVMVAGRLMQTGEPRELYDHPSDIAVARFLGRNNLIKAMRLSSSNTDDGEFKTLEGGHKLHLPVTHAILSPMDQPVFLAIRPEHVQIHTNGDSGTNSLRGNIREIVFAGATSTVRVDAAGLVLEALVLQPDGLTVNQECTVVLPHDRLTLLQNQSG
jgi:ABC-type Fe3+/spermidine/putrescine transport system ATPase subunit